MKKLLTGAFVTTLLAIALPASASASTVAYNNIPNLGNVPSVGFEATSAKEFGGQIQLISTDRNDPTITVLMSSWGCESGHWNLGNCSTTSGTTFSHDITLNIYNVNNDNTPGSLITTATQTFNIPFRPSADATNCTGDDAGKWHDGSTCYNGFATPISFNLTGVTLPDKVIISVVYNTTHYGDSPMGESASCYTSLGGCGYDALNVGTYSSPSVGSYPLPADAYQSSTWGGAYCASNQTTTGTFRLDAGCWTGYQPAIKVEATTPAPVSCPSGTTQSSLIETVPVNSNSSLNTPSTSVLTNGQTYLLVSSGTWQNGGLNTADTEFASADNWSTHMNGYDINPYFLGEGEFDLRINDTFVDWGSYNPGHSYSRLYTGTGSALNLGIFDGDSNTNTLNSGWYGDNTGTLSVAIYSCIPTVIPPTDCPAAPSIAANYLKTHGKKPASADFKNIISLVAKTMGPQTDFQSVKACDTTNYLNMVTDFVEHQF